MEILVFEVERERFALPLEDLQEVIRAVAVTRLPRAPAVVAGVIDVRGALVPVLDLRRRFGLPLKELTPSDHLILARANDRVVALHVDRADRLVEVGPAEIEDMQALVRGAEYVAGVARLPEGVVLIHDVHAFLSQAESAALADALAASGQS